MRAVPSCTVTPACVAAAVPNSCLFSWREAGRRAMAANISDASYADRPQPVDKTDARLEIWHCFSYVADTQG